MQTLNKFWNLKNIIVEIKTLSSVFLVHLSGASSRATQCAYTIEIKMAFSSAVIDPR